MLMRADIDAAQRGSYSTRPIRNHAVFRTPGLEFVPRPVVWGAPACRDLPQAGNLMLWRVRAEWHGMPRDEGLSWLSPVERERARKCYPNPALAKRYLVGRAVLRRILSGMLGCSPGAVDLVDGPGRQLRLRGAAAAPVIEVAYAGTWILVGIGATGLGLGTVVPVAGWDLPAGEGAGNTDPGAKLAARLFPDLPGVGQRAQQCARRESVSRLAASHDLGTRPEVAAHDGAAFLIASADGHNSHGGLVLDLPMPGRIAGAVALAGTVTRVDAFGWMRD